MIIGYRGFFKIFAAALTIMHVVADERSVGEIGFAEDFAFADDRSKVLEQLVPGTDDYYYYHALHLQNTAQHSQLPSLIQEWRARIKTSERRTVIENREAILLVDRDREAGFSQIVQRLNLEFDHESDDPEVVRGLASVLDPESISAGRVYEQWLERKANHFERISTAWILREGKPLETPLRRTLLAEAKRPDLPNLIELIEEDLKSKASSGFGEFQIHRQLLPEQLDYLALRYPELRNSSEFIATRIGKMRPMISGGAMEQQRATMKFLDEAWKYLKPMPPVHVSLKLHVLNQLLIHRRAFGVYDRELFDAYLEIARDRSYMRKAYLEYCKRRQIRVADADFDASDLTGLESVGDDAWLIQDYLSHFIAGGVPWDAFSTYLSAEWLKPVAGAAGLIKGVGDPERWVSMLEVSDFAALRDRVDLEMVPESKMEFVSGELVELTLVLKNVQSLQVRVYEINGLNHCRDFGSNVSLSVDLGGLMPTDEQTHEFTESPLLQHRETFSFPKLQGRRGVWVVDFIGSGKRCRALIRKGSLDFLVQEQPGAFVFTIYDEDKKLVPHSELWVGNRRFSADDKGEVIIPFSQESESKPVIIADGKVARLVDFHFPSEEYRLEIDCQLENEELMPGQKATLLVRPQLLLNRRPASPGQLKDVTLTLSAESFDSGVKSQKSVSDITISEESEIAHEFTIPARLSRLVVTMKGRLEVQSQFGNRTVEAIWELYANGIEESASTNQAFLIREQKEYVVEVRDKSGQMRPGIPVTFQFSHEIGLLNKVALRTNELGRIHLGLLDRIDRVVAIMNGDKHASFVWDLDTTEFDYPDRLHALAGEDFELPWFGGSVVPDRTNLSLLAVQQEKFTADWFSAISIDQERGLLRLSDLPEGDYRLTIQKEFDHEVVVNLAVGKGIQLKGHVVSDHRVLELPKSGLLQISNVGMVDGNVVIQLANLNPFTRVHVSATSFMPISLPAFRNRYWYTDMRKPTLARNEFGESQPLGDEMRYIAERRQARLFPGNMLQRPGLLLSPWSVAVAPNRRSHEFQESSVAFGGSKSGGGDPFGGFDSVVMGSPVVPWTFSFLGSAPIRFVNIKPDAQGRVEIPVDSFQGRSHLQVIAADPEQCVSQLAFLEKRAAPQIREVTLLERDRLASDQPLAQKDSIVVLKQGDVLKLSTDRKAPFEGIDSVSSAFELLRVLVDDQKFGSFQFLMDWPSLPALAKERYYSEFACHELHVFLWRKDPAFFDTIIRPYLSNKLEKGFIDHFLLGDDLGAYLKPWRYAQLNAAERALIVHRFPDRAEALARRVEDDLAAIPVDISARERIFNTALTVRELDEQLSESLSGEMRREAIAQEQIENAREIERLLKTGVGYYDLGQYDQARESFNRILVLDRFNTSARSLLEKTDRTIMNHLRTARDQMRSDMIRQVDELWQVPVPETSLQQGATTSKDIKTKLDRIMIPSVQMDQATLEEAITFLRIKTRQLDDLEPDPERKGVNFVVKTGDAPKITLSLTNVPASYVLQAIADLAGCRVRIEPFAAVVVPLTDSGSGEMETRTYEVAPDFLSLGTRSSDDDPFAEPSASSGLSSRTAPADILAAAGIAFGEGATAFYNPATGQLTVRNSASQLDLVGQFLVDDADSSAEPVAKSEAAKPSYFPRGASAMPVFYQKMPETEELAESQYYRAKLAETGAGFITVNRFWQDYARWDGKGEFLSPYFGEAASSLSGALLALALLDLPFEPEKAETSLEGNQFTTTARTPLIVFHREIDKVESPQDATSPILVSQKFFKSDERYVNTDAAKRVKYVSKAFLFHTVYTMEIVLTNTGESEEVVDLLVQIPAGSMTVKHSKEMLTERLVLKPFATRRLGLQFYFPQSGTFSVFPATVAQDSSLMARAAPFTCEVVEFQKDIDVDSWHNVAQFADDNEVLRFLQVKPIRHLELDRVAWRVKRSHDFLQSATAILNERGVYDRTLFSYGLHHRDDEIAGDFIAREAAFLDRCGSYLDTKLVKIDPVADREFEHLEYEPLINARAHQLGGARTITNDRFFEHYQSWLGILCCKPSMADSDRLRAVYYLFLQDRVDEALRHFVRIRPETISNQLQFDYLSCVVAFYSESPQAAMKIAEIHAKHPIKRWRDRFTDVIRQVEEISGSGGEDPGDLKDREQRQNRLADVSPALELTLEGGQLKLKHRNVRAAKVRYYRMDLEVLFSSNPFMEYDTRRFGLVSPAHEEALTFSGENVETTLTRPDFLDGENCLVEATGGGECSTRAIFAHSFRVDVAEAYGQLQVSSSDESKPLPKVYAKVYRREADLGVRFHKDGYTDLRGKFDYVSVNAETVEDGVEFAILLLSEKNGAQVIYVRGL